jgi:hypothetical protein
MMATDPWIAMHAEKAGVPSGFFLCMPVFGNIRDLAKRVRVGKTRVPPSRHPSFRCDDGSGLVAGPAFAFGFRFGLRLWFAAATGDAAIHMNHSVHSR